MNCKNRKNKHGGVIVNCAYCGERINVNSDLGEDEKVYCHRCKHIAKKELENRLKLVSKTFTNSFGLMNHEVAKIIKSDADCLNS